MGDSGAREPMGSRIPQVSSDAMSLLRLGFAVMFAAGLAGCILPGAPILDPPALDDLGDTDDPLDGILPIDESAASPPRRTVEAGVLLSRVDPVDDAAGWTALLDRDVFEVGTVVRFTIWNEGPEAHAFAIPDLNVQLDAIPAGGARVVTVALDREGEYAFHCPLHGHAEAGLAGVLKAALVPHA